MPEASENQENRKKILVIDDHESARNLLKRRLSMYGYDVLLAATFDSARTTLSEASVDVIFLNTIINGVNSDGFLKELKEDEDFRGIPVIMMYSDTNPDLIIRCIELGAEDYLMKPIRSVLLKNRLAKCLTKRSEYDKEMAYLKQIEQNKKYMIDQDRMASIGTLINSMSQELKNPLNFAINFSKVSAEISGEICEKIEEEKGNIDIEFYNYLSQNLKRFQANIQRVFDYTTHVDKVLQFILALPSEIDQMQPGNINKIITQTVTMLLNSYRINGISNIPKIKTELDEDEMPHVMISPQALSRAIYNMLDNAIYFTMAKYEDLSKAIIQVSSKNEEDSIAISVYDNGVGIASENIDEIFEPFFSTKKRRDGIGLGLYSAKNIIEKHGGELSVESKEGEFTRFSFSIKKEKLDSHRHDDEL